MTHVFHGSIEGIPLCSIDQKRSHGKTTWQFHLDEHRIQCCSFSTDLEDTTNVWSPFASGHLLFVSARPANDGINL